MFAHLSVKAYGGGGLQALADVSAKNLSYFLDGGMTQKPTTNGPIPLRFLRKLAEQNSTNNLV